MYTECKSQDNPLNNVLLPISRPIAVNHLLKVTNGGMDVVKLDYVL